METVDPPEKSLFKSKTFWFNLLTLLVVILSEIINELPNLGEGSIGIIAVFNIILRAITNKGAYIA